MIPAEQLAEVRSRHELIAFLTASGVKLRRQGTDYLGFCPFHDDRKPSFSVSPSKQYWCCLGSCSTPTKKLGGDVIEFARKLWGLSFREAVARLGGQTTTELNTTRPKLRVVKRNHPDTTAPALPDLLTQVATYYHQTLSSSLRAKEYLTERGITNPEIISSLLVGCADGSLMERAPEGSDTHARLAALGVINGKGRELLEGCIVVPLRDLHGNIVSLYGRATGRDQHLYLPGPHRGLVNAQCAATTQEIVIAESVIDALSFLEAGITNVVPMYGTNGWTSDHEALLDHHRIRRVILALDNDEAGRRASAALADKLVTNGLDVRVIELDAKDANEMLVRDGAAVFAATWQQLIAAPIAQLHPAPTAAKEEAAAPPTSSADEEPQPDVLHDAEAGAYVVSFGARTYRVRGLSAFGVDRMRVNVRVEEAGRFHVDTFDLYAARSRKNFIEAAVQALAGGPTATAVMSRQMAVLIDVLETQRLVLREGNKENAKPVMSVAEREEAMAMLCDPKLVRRLVEDFAAAGCVGEEASMVIGYLASISRKLDEPLAVLFCARSGAGKSNMQDRITDFIPPEDLVRYTRITGQALFYQEEDALKHKVLALDEEGGATDAIYSLRILQSSGTLSVSATRTDPQTGKHRAEHYEVHGPTSIMLTTAHPEALDYETRNRFVLLTADESSEQTRRILERQRWGETLEGLIAKKKREAVIRRHRDVQRLIEPLHVVNPHAPSLTFPSGRLILRREQKKYLTLIKAIALLHQHQRRRKSVEIGGERIDYIEVTREDIALAQKLAPSILRRNLDELAPPTRALLDAIRELVATKMKTLKVPKEYAHISRQELQQHTGLSYWHLRVYLQQLVECEYLALVRGENGKRYLYELLADPDGDDPAAEIGG